LAAIAVVVAGLPGLSSRSLHGDIVVSVTRRQVVMVVTLTQFVAAHTIHTCGAGLDKLSEDFIAEVYADWCEHGAAALQTVRQNRPEVYVKVVASLLPREVHAEITGPTHEDRVTELMERLAQLDSENAAKAGRE
jgi:hypothetical protein